MLLACSRFIFLLALVASAAVLGASLYLEYGPGLSPCLLCLVQRYLLLAFCGVNLIAFVHAPRAVGVLAYSMVAMLLALAGLASATCQVLYQRLPAQQLMICQPDLAQLWNNLSLGDLFTSVYRGTEACAHIQWTLFDLSIPELSMLAFAGLAALSLFQWVRYFLPRKKPGPATRSSTSY